MELGYSDRNEQFLRSEFMKIDTSRDGYLDKRELRVYLKLKVKSLILKKMAIFAIFSIFEKILIFFSIQMKTLALLTKYSIRLI